MGKLQLTERKNSANAEYAEGEYVFSGTVTVYEDTNTISDSNMDIRKKVDSTETYIGRLSINGQKNNKPKIGLYDLTAEDLSAVSPIVNEMIKAIEEDYSTGHLQL